jgi:o-succinylbenzoate synthase
VELEDLVGTARVVRVPLHTRFRGVTEREAVLLHGPAGWGEFAPFVEYGDAEAARWLAAAVEAALVGWPAPLRGEIPVNATVPAVAAADVPAVLARFPGCTTAKVKVAEPGQTLADDVARVAAVRATLGPAGRIRVDANAAWTVEEAVTALDELGAAGLEYAEQPCATLAELAELRTRTGVLIAADEVVRKAADPAGVDLTDAADVVVVKAAPLGGVRPALAAARGYGLPVVVSSALDTSVGLAAGVALAAALPDLPYACGLGTAGLLADDVTGDPLVPRAGTVPVRPVTPDRLDAVEAPADRRAWWLARLSRCAALLPATGETAVRSALRRRPAGS